MLTKMMIGARIGLHSLVKQVRERESGQTFVEYALIVGGLSIALLASFLALTGEFDGIITTIGNCLSDTTTCPGV
jgi:Flp pilus assembly pilin Flp